MEINLIVVLNAVALFISVIVFFFFSEGFQVSEEEKDENTAIGTRLLI